MSSQSYTVNRLVAMAGVSSSYKRKAPHQYEGFDNVQPRKRANIGLLDAPSNVSDVAALSTKYNDLLEKGAISQETLIANFPGFVENRYQQIATSIESYESSQLPSFNVQKVIAIDLDFPKPWDPSTATLVIDAQFTQADGKTAMAVGDVPVNYFPFSWFKMIKVMVQNTTTPINNAEDGIREKSLFDLRYNTTKDYKELIRWNYLSSSEKSTSIARRDNKKPLAGAHNLVDRNTVFGASVRDLTDSKRFEIDLAMLDKFFAISKLMDPSLKYRLEIVLENEMNKVFETNQTRADDKEPHKTYNNIIIKNKPFVRVTMLGTTNDYETTFDTLMSGKGVYTLLDFFDQKKAEFDIGPNIVTTEFDIPETGIQFSHLIFQLQPNVSALHSSMYDTYDVNTALVDILKIEVSGIYDNEKLITRKWNFDDKNDQTEIYQNYLAFKTGGGLSLTNTYHYRKMQRDSGKNDGEDGELVSQHDYFTGDHRYGKDIIMDIRPSRGYTQANDPPMPNIRPKIKIQLRKGNPLGQKLLILCNHPASYNLTTDDSRIRKVVYRPVAYKN